MHAICPPKGSGGHIVYVCYLGRVALTPSVRERVSRILAVWPPRTLAVWPLDSRRMALPHLCTQAGVGDTKSWWTNPNPAYFSSAPMSMIELNSMDHWRNHY